MIDFGRDTLVRLVGGRLLIREGGTSPQGMLDTVALVNARALNLVIPFSQWKRARGGWFSQNRAIFAAQGIPRWPDITEGWRLWKVQHGLRPEILRATDELKDSLTKDTSFTIFEARPRSLRAGTTSPHSPPNRDKREHIMVLEDSFLVLNQLCIDYILGGGGRRRIPSRGVSRRSPTFGEQGEE